MYTICSKKLEMTDITLDFFNFLISISCNTFMGHFTIFSSTFFLARIQKYLLGAYFVRGTALLTRQGPLEFTA